MRLKQAKFITIIILLAVFNILLLSCRKTASPPPIKPIAIGPAINIQQLRNLFFTTGQNMKFTSNTILNVVVTADENSGQLYKQVYVRDNSGTFVATNYYGAISLNFLHGTGGFLNQGDSIAVNLNGASLVLSSGGSLQIDSLEASLSCIHLKSGLNPLPIVATIPQLNTYTTVPGSSYKEFMYDAQLVQLNNVEFISSNVGTDYAVAQNPPAAPVNVNKYVCDYTGNTMVAYNSGYANFAGTPIPTNSGTLTAVANLYTTMQLSIRQFSDISLSNPYKPVVYDTITQNFVNVGLYSKSQIEMGGWQTVDIQGHLFWEGYEYGTAPNYKYNPSVSNYKSSDLRNDIWLISPPIKAYGSNPKYMNFSVANQYGTSTSDLLLSVWVCGSLFDGTHVIPSQWTCLSAGTGAGNLFPYIPFNSTGNSFPIFVWANNGQGNFIAPALIQITAPTPNSGTFYVAFRYQSTTNPAYPDSSGVTYEINNFILKNNP
jgi:hypothetical protein